MQQQSVPGRTDWFFPLLPFSEVVDQEVEAQLLLRVNRAEIWKALDTDFIIQGYQPIKKGENKSPSQLEWGERQRGLVSFSIYAQKCSESDLPG